MKWDTVRFCQDYRIRYTVSRRWHQTDCPWCGNNSLKAGFSLGGGTFSCFVCSSHPVSQTVARMLLCSEAEAIEIIQNYQGSYSTANILTDEQVSASIVDLPGRKKMRKKHRLYLEGRGFDPDELTKEWSLRFTGPAAEYGWEWRIIFPIFHKNELVSYQGRDVTNNEGVIRYRGARIEDSKIHYKKLLYGIEKCRNNTVVVVEGIFDMFNFGPGAVTAFGTSLTLSQVRLLAELERVVFLFDPDDPLAWKKAKKYVLELRTLGVKAERIRYDGGDPGSLSRDEVRYLRKYIGFGG